jgi:hypothetical protein
VIPSGTLYGYTPVFTQELANAICADLSAGKSLRAACAQDGRPAPSTVLQWTEENAAFGEQYARARARGYMLLADEILAISDDSSGDMTAPVKDGNGDTIAIARPNPEFVARSRLRVDSRKWMLSKMLPKVYGDKVEHEHKGSVNIVATSQDEKL